MPNTSKHRLKTEAEIKAFDKGRKKGADDARYQIGILYEQIASLQKENEALSRILREGKEGATDIKSRSVSST